VAATAAAFRAAANRPGTRPCPDWERSVAPGDIPQEHPMTVARITEISSVSSVSFQDAIVEGVARANKTLKNVKGAWVKDQEVTIDNGKVTGYKVVLKVTFILQD
jgi:flavin-binding protein dodecin